MPTTPNFPHQPNDEAPRKPGTDARVNDGSNDNPDEFSEFRKSGSSATEDYSRESRQADPAQQPGHVEQNQNPEGVAAAQNASYDEQREAWADDDPRYGSGPRPDTGSGA
ncbi:hypothetical protein [Hymenobacter latericus]|uniref:hypothetical protein n=1 Tax=Hymenobacter sp. YIM 151858-1 TaxID=2987688 RepID=UPI002227B0BC|nr:hypothetical protein [Hymenobacter sp. YIM 151858-1]UYZ59545.1 hypothetical protein OIS50_01805 [Hymenobacter sp. YIM 151858-1]